jgi:CheY-like chemotaxis protein
MRLKSNTIYNLDIYLKLGLNNKQIQYKWHLKKTLFSFIVCLIFKKKMFVIPKANNRNLMGLPRAKFLLNKRINYYYSPRRRPNWQKKMLFFGLLWRFFAWRSPNNGWDSHFKGLRLAIAICPLRDLQSDTFLTPYQPDKKSLIAANRNFDLKEIYSHICVILKKINDLYRKHLSLTPQICITDINNAVATSCLLPLSPMLFQRKGNTDPSVKNPKVLLVEDNEVIASVHKNFLLQLGCKVDVATNGHEALMIARHPYSLILLDIGLPDMSGIEVARTLQSCLQDRCPPMVAITAMSGEDTIKACLASGIQRVLTKPINLKCFENILTQLTLNNYSQQGDFE